MRTILQLLIILHANKQLYIDREMSGLCRLCNDLRLLDIISYEEKELLTNYITDNQPKKGDKYYHIISEESAWFWPARRWYYREYWLNAEIKKLSNKK